MGKNFGQSCFSPVYGHVILSVTVWNILCMTLLWSFFPRNMYSICKQECFHLISLLLKWHKQIFHWKWRWVCPVYRTRCFIARSLGPFFINFFARPPDAPKRSAAHLYPLRIRSCPPLACPTWTCYNKVTKEHIRGIQYTTSQLYRSVQDEDT